MNNFSEIEEEAAFEEHIRHDELFKNIDLIIIEEVERLKLKLLK